jgi:hypothetical protein
VINAPATLARTSLGAFATAPPLLFTCALNTTPLLDYKSKARLLPKHKLSQIPGKSYNNVCKHRQRNEHQFRDW